MLDSQRWQVQFLRNKWLHVNEEIAYQKMISCNKIMGLKNLGKCLCKVKDKWENGGTETMQGLGEMRGEL
jgi:hypothetical protein